MANTGFLPKLPFYVRGNPLNHEYAGSVWHIHCLY